MLAPKQTSRTLKRNKMKIRQFLFAACTALVLTACSKDAIDNGHANAVEIDNITITEEPFEPETPAKSSAKQTRAVQAPQIVDLGDGLIAEVSLTEDAHEETPARTRAAIADGHYTIYATKPVPGSTPGDGSGTYMGKLSGTVQGGKFVRDASSSPMRLAPDTYTFVCVNDAFPISSGTFQLTNDLDNPMMAIVTMPISGKIVEIPFVMKHRNTSRIRFQITSYTAEGHGITGKLAFTFIQTKNLYDIEGRAFGGLAGAFTSGTYTFAESPVTPSAYTQITKRTTDYRYFLYGAQGANAQFTIDGGSIYGKSLAGKSFPLTAIANLQENKSYTCNIKLKPAVLYLFQDGTVGTLAEKGSRTPIGVVAREKTETQEGIAAGLDIIKKEPNPTYDWEDESVTGHSGIQLNTTVYNGLHDGQNDMNGYKWTWDANSTTDHVVRAEEQAKYPAFYMAGHYRPSVAVTGENIGKWYIPAMGEVVQLFKRFGKVTISATEPWRGSFSMQEADLKKAIKAFSDVNCNIDHTFLWTSTTCDAVNTGSLGGPYAPASFYIRPNDVWVPTFSKHGDNFYILPFVKF